MNREDWLNQVQEDIIEPERPICDPHHHLWDHLNIPGLKGSRYLLDELLADLGSGHNVVSTVFVECAAQSTGRPAAASRHRATCSRREWASTMW